MAGAQAIFWEFKQLKSCAEENEAQQKDPWSTIPVWMADLLDGSYTMEHHTSLDSWFTVFIYVGKECTFFGLQPLQKTGVTW